MFVQVVNNYTRLRIIMYTFDNSILILASVILNDILFFVQ